SMDNTDRFSGILVACDLKQAQLADVMNSLWSLVGSKSGVWEWKEDTRQSPARYALRPTLNARQLAERLRQAMQERFEAHAETLIHLAFMSLEERSNHAEDLRNSIGSDDPSIAGIDLKQYMAKEDVWAAIRLFATLLSAEQRKRVLNGETIKIPLGSLSKEARQSALALAEGRARERREIEARVRGSQAKQEPEKLEEPVDGITFAGNVGSSSTRHRNHMTIMIGFSQKTSTSSSGYFGISPDGNASDIFADWILPGDVRKLEVETRAIAALPMFKPEEIWSKVPFLDYNIAAAASVESVSFMAVVPESPTTGDVSGIAAGKTPEQYFSEMWRWKTLMHKWRDGILLAHYPEWFYGDEALCPYALVKRLRISLQKQDGVLSLEDIADPVTTLSAAQLKRLTVEFPFTGMQIDTTDDVRVQPMTALCTFYLRYPKALSERGILIDLKMRAFFQDPNLWPRNLRIDEGATAARMVDVPNQSAAGSGHTYRLEVATSTHNWRYVASFNIVRIASKQ
ncbi:MAG: hypothetical protein JWN14_2689, partial [Chthonomonadales bacterium]|nr:hypothetical protein [Chthonomonadales bacterium]